MMNYLIRIQDAIKHCQCRLYESALNNIGYECKADEVFTDIAQNRIQTWLEEVPSARLERKCEMYNLKDFFENGLFDILGAFYNVKFVVRSGLTMHEHGTYNEIMDWIKTSGYGRHEVVSAKLDFIMDVIEVQIR